MKERMHRTQILLQPEQHRALSRIAQQEDRSISEIIRDLVHSELDRREHNADANRQRQLAALEQIRRHREEILAERGGKPIDLDPVELINQIREERDAELVSRNFDRRD